MSSHKIASLELIITSFATSLNIWSRSPFLNGDWMILHCLGFRWPVSEPKLSALNKWNDSTVTVIRSTSLNSRFLMLHIQIKMFFNFLPTMCKHRCFRAAAPGLWLVVIVVTLVLKCTLLQIHIYNINRKNVDIPLQIRNTFTPSEGV